MIDEIVIRQEKAVRDRSFVIGKRVCLPTKFCRNTMRKELRAVSSDKFDASRALLISLEKKDKTLKSISELLFNEGR